MAVATRELSRATRGASPRLRSTRASAHRFRFFSELSATDPDGWLQIFPIGKYTYSDVGAIEITKERCANFVKNFDENARGHVIPVNREHVAELGAVGWFKELAQRDDGVWAKVDWTDDGEELIQKQAFKFISPEFYDEYADPKTGEVYKDLLVGCAITNYPRFFDMTPIAANERVAAAMKSATESFEERIDAVRDALQELYGWDMWIDDEGTFEDHVIVEWMGDWWSFPYTRSADGAVSLGIPTEVERTFTPATAASARKANKSRLHKEAGMATDKSGAAAEKPGTGGITTIAPSEKPVAASEGNVVISASELSTLREQAAQAPAAMAEAKRSTAALRLMATDDVITKAKNAGQLVPAEEAFWRDELVNASDERFASLKKYLSDKPKVVNLTAEGAGGSGESDESKRLDAAATKYMSEHKDATYRDALLAVSKEAK